MNKLEKGRFYFLKVLISGRELEYNCKILERGEENFRVYTKDGDCLRFDLKDVVYFKEIESFEGEPKIVVRKKRVPWKDLKKEAGPEF